MNYKLADTVFDIEFFHPKLAALFAEYATGLPAETAVRFSSEDIDCALDEFLTKSRPYCELLLIHKAVSTYLLDYKDGFIFHSSSIAIKGGGAIVFTAESGTGKSTQSRHWKECFGDEVFYVNDDKPFMRLVGGQFIVYGSPWNGKHRLGGNVSAPVEHICFLFRGETDRVEKISTFEAIPLFFNQTLGFADSVRQIKLLSLLDKLFKTVKISKIYCTDTTKSALIIRKGLEEL